MFDNSEQAAIGYEQAHLDLLATGLNEDQLDSYFNQAVVLPVMSLEVDWPNSITTDNESSINFQAWSSIYPGAQQPSELISHQRNSALTQSLLRATVQIERELIRSTSRQKSQFDYRVSGHDVLDYAPQNSDVFTRIFQEVPLLQFRPRIVKGELASHESVLMSYHFAPD